jgi:hypothetical protein
MQLSPRERKLTTDQVIAELRPKFQRIPGINVLMQNRPPIRIGGYFTRALPIHHAGRRSSGAVCGFRKAAGDAAGSGVRRREYRPRPVDAIGQRQDRPRRAASLGITANKSKSLWARLLAACAYRRSTPRPTNIGRSWNCCRNIRRTRTLSTTLSPTARTQNITGNVGSLVPLSAVAKITPEHPAADGEPFGSARGCDRFVQPAQGVALSDAVNEITG